MPIIMVIEEALKNLDSLLLNKNQISALLREYITEEELAEYEAINDINAKWEKQEEFLLGLYKIPFSKIKLIIWNFILDFNENYESVLNTVKFVKLACEEIKENTHILKKLFSYILTIGNILNAGSNKGQADGFGLEILSKLSVVKDNSGKNVIQIICLFIKKEDEQFGNDLKKNFCNVAEASKTYINEAQATLNKLKKDLKENFNHLNQISSLEDAYVLKVNSTFDTFQKLINDIDQDLTKTILSYQELVNFFGYSNSDIKFKNPEEFFSMLNDFIIEVEKSLPKEEIKKAYNRKHEIGAKIVENINSTENNMDSILKKLKMRMSNE